jgi:protein-tyrosine phosphatase
MTFVDVIVVCSGNICRSPMAEAVLRRAFDEAGLGATVHLSSAGTGSWHVGQPADRRAVTLLANLGYDATAHRARQFTAEWFDRAPGLVLALDRGHLATLRALTDDPQQRERIRLLRSFDPSLAQLTEDDRHLDVPDPYYDDSFGQVMAMLLAAAPGVVEHVRSMLGPTGG